MMRQPQTELLLAEELGRRILKLLEPIRVMPVSSPKEMEAVYKLRADVVQSHGWSDGSESPKLGETDAYDADAVHFVAAGPDGIIGTSRLVYPSAGQLLPTEAAFDVRIDPWGSAADLGRMIVLPQKGLDRHYVFLALLFRSWLEARTRGVNRLCGAVDRGMIRLYERLGFVLQVVGPEREYWGEIRSPVVWRPELSYRSLMDRWGKLLGADS